jgi:pyruvate kinase
MAAAERIIAAAREHGKELILAAGLLVSLERAEKPSIAEISDLWHYHQAGVRQFLLSGTVCISRPLEAARWGTRLLTRWDEEAGAGR